MKTWTEIKGLLDQPLDQKEIRFREGDYGKQVPYLPGDYVVRELNTVFGVDGWAERDANVSYRLFEREEKDRNGNKRLMYIACAMAKTTLEVWGIYPKDAEQNTAHREGLYQRSGEGVCSNKSSRPESAIETAVKGAATDALKRAAMKLGNPFGLCLYNEEYRNTLTIPESKPRDNVVDISKGRNDPRTEPEERRTHCEKCGTKLVRKTGTSKKTGDDWAMWVCPKSPYGKGVAEEDKHPVVWED